MISYGGIQLNLEDGQGQTRDFLNRYLELEAVRLFGGMPPGQTGYRLKSRSRDVPSGTGLPLPNYLPGPKPCINRLYWPQGATRWGYIVVPIRKDQLVQLTELAIDEDGNNPLTLVIEDTNGPRESGRKITLSMYMLPPRPVSIPDYDDGLWLLPLVDVRYYWQFRTPANLLLTQATGFYNTWDSLLNVIADSLCVDLDWDDVDPKYGSPNAVEFSRSYESGAALLDAVAYSIGQRLTFSFEDSLLTDFMRDTSTSTTSAPGQNITPSPATCGSRRQSAALVSWDTSDEYYDDNFQTLTWYQIGGGDFSSQITASMYPEKIVVTFPKYQINNDGTQTALATGELYGITKNAGDGEPAYFSAIDSTLGMVAVIHSAARALIFNTNIINQDGLNSLADQIARDYYASLEKRFDYSFASILNWQPTGYDDYMEVSMERYRDGGYNCRTRIQSFPYNHGITEVLQQLNSTTSSTTSTTLAPCLGTCTYTATSDGLGWTTTSSGCSGITGCNCIPPQWCPVDGSCSTATTYCGSGILPPSPPCAGSTTTTTSSTSSTSSTTCSPFQPLPPGPCSAGCDWSSSSGGFAFVWNVIKNGCLDPDACTCCRPSFAPSNACQLTHTNCCWVPPATTAPPQCYGTCDWQWGIDSIGDFLWNQTSGGCVKFGATDLICTCDAPGSPGAACEEKAITYCYFHYPPTTSTTTLAPTTTLGPGYCTTPQPGLTTPAPTTSTTPAPGTCGDCIVRWNGSAWIDEVNNCGSCGCVLPNDTGTTCETRMQPCNTTTTSTTTTTTTSTTCGPVTSACCGTLIDCSLRFDVSGHTDPPGMVSVYTTYNPSTGKWSGISTTGLTCNSIQYPVTLSMYCGGSDLSDMLLDLSIGGCNLVTGMPLSGCVTTSGTCCVHPSSDADAFWDVPFPVAGPCCPNSSGFPLEVNVRLYTVG